MLRKGALTQSKYYRYLAIITNAFRGHQVRARHGHPGDGGAAGCSGQHLGVGSDEKR